MARRTGPSRRSSDRPKSDAPVNPSDSSVNGTHPPSGAAEDTEQVVPVRLQRGSTELARWQDPGKPTEAIEVRAELIPARPLALDVSGPPPDMGSVVHDVLGGLDESFGSEATQLENEALAEAKAWAEKDLP